MLKKASILLAFISSAVFSVSGVEVGLTGGEFRVDESGAATYSIPLSVAPGRAGVAPQVGLNYSSNNGFEGPVGVGWSISGLSSISRCPQTPVHDGGEIRGVQFDSGDRFCLDGQRLLLTDATATYGENGATYRTEIDNFAIITSHGGTIEDGPAYFTVENKAGETHYYGDAGAAYSAFDGDDAFVEPGGTTDGNLARSWAIKIIEDVKGNYIRFNYKEDTALGTFYIDNIEYAGWTDRATNEAPFAKVDFVYEEYKKGFMGYMAGSKVYHNQLLKRIDSLTKNNATYEVFRSYHLDYENSNFIEERTLLTTVQECSDSARTECLPATTFTWQRPALSTSTIVEFCETEPGYEGICYDAPTSTNYTAFNTTTQINSNVYNDATAQVLDINGDGYSDIVYVDAGVWKVKSGHYKYSGGVSIPDSGYTDKPEYALNIDYDGDGVRDLMVANSDSEDWMVLTSSKVRPTDALCSGTSGCTDYIANWDYKIIDTNLTAKGLEGGAIVMDVDGDGMEDIVYREGKNIMAAINNFGNGNGNFIVETLFTAQSPWDGSQLDFQTVSQSADLKATSAIDINGDGRSDLISKITETTSECLVNGNPQPANSRPECNDLMGTWTSYTVTDYRLFVSTGLRETPQLEEVQNLGRATYMNTLRMADLNGDGLSDLLYVSESDDKWYYRLSDGTKLLGSQSTGLTTTDTRKFKTFFVDLNADGRADVLHATSDTNWGIYFSRPTQASDFISFEYRGSKTFTKDANIRFGDTNGDGKIDLVMGKDGNWHEHTTRAGIKDYSISDITNGFGVNTHIDYGSMAHINENVYVMQLSDYDTNVDVFSPISGMQLVKKVTSDINEINGDVKKVSVSYQYGGMLVHKKGRGSLGFQMLRTIDDQTGVISETQYHQGYEDDNINGLHFANARMPLYTQQAFNGEIISSATNTLAVQSSAQGGYLPYIEQSVEKGYVYNSDGSVPVPLVSTTTTDNSYDTWGNLTNSTVSVVDEVHALTATTTTVNDFGTSDQQKLGRLQSTTVTKNRTGQTAISRKTNFTYNTDNMLKTSVVSPDAEFMKDEQNTTVAGAKLTTTYGYDKYGNKTSVSVTGNSLLTTSEQTRTTSTVYKNGRFIDYVENALGEKVTYKYNGVSATSFTGGVINNTSKTSPNGLTSTTHYDAFGNITSKVDVTGNTTTVSRSYDVGAVVTGAHYMVTQTHPGSADKEVYYDRWGREIGKRVQGFVDGSWILSTLEYDARGRQVRAYEPGSTTEFTTYEYDELDRVNKITKPNGGIILQSVSGLTSTTTNELNQNTMVTTNAFGETHKTEDASGNTVEFTYDSYGNLLTSATNGTDNIVASFYDDYGRKYKTVDPIKGTWKYTYNAFGELLSQTTARSDTFELSYDILGRKIRSYNADEGMLCWEYGTSSTDKNIGKLVSSKKFVGQNVACSDATNPAIEKTFDYDLKGRPEKVVTKIDAGTKIITYTQSQVYDEFSRPLSTTQNPADTDAVTWTNAYNDTGYLATVSKDGTVLKTITGMNERLQVTTVNYANNVSVANVFDSQTGWLSKKTVAKNSSSINTVDMTYDKMGNVLSRESNYHAGITDNTHFTESYEYDVLNRLNKRSIAVAENGKLSSPFTDVQVYVYDKWGNFTYKEGAGFYQYDANDVHRLIGIYDNAAFSGEALSAFQYDANGNITADGKRKFEYASFDKPVFMSMDDGSASSKMSYGVNRELYLKEDCFYANDKKTTVTTAYFGSYEQMERVGGESDITEYKFHAGEMVYTKRSDNTSDTFYSFKDHQGSTILTVDNAGDVVSEAIYDPWGKRTAIYQSDTLSLKQILPPTDRGYTGHKEIGAMGIIHMGGRIYDPVIGRFLQADPFVQAPLNSQNYNRYSYVLNNPMSYTDPSGYFFKALGKFVKKYWRQIASIAVMFIPGVNVMVLGALSGYISTGSLKGALVGAFSAGLAGPANSLSGFITNGIVGGLASKALGGKFGHGFWSAGLGALAGGQIGGLKTAGMRIVASAIVGGTISKLTGGKFANGAFGAAFARTLGEAKNGNLSRFSGGEGSGTGSSNPVTSQGIVEVGDSEFSYTSVGPEGFSDQVAESLSTIASTEAGAEVLNGIMDSGGEVTFEYREGTFATKGEWFGKNSTIYFDPNHSVPIVTSGNLFRNSNPTMVLSHELYHAWNNAASNWYTGGGARRIGTFVRGLPSQEAYAVRHTNLVRRQLGLGYIRTHYRHQGSQYCVEGC